MEISFPVSNGTCPPNYTIWGTYNAINPAANGAATMTNVANNNVVNANNFQFRSDGVWMAQFAGLQVGAVYNVNASYVCNGTTVYAPMVENVTVQQNAPVVSPPPPPPPPPPPDDDSFSRMAPTSPPRGEANGEAEKIPPVRPFLFYGTCSATLPIVRLSAVTWQESTSAVASNVAGIVCQGQWAVLIPPPQQGQPRQYLCDLLFLDEQGRVLQQTRLRLP